jgi:hypothetical protein
MFEKLMDNVGELAWANILRAAARLRIIAVRRS